MKKRNLIKTVVIVCLVSSFAVGCGNQPTQSGNKSGITSQTGMEWADSYFKVWNEALYEKLGAYYTEDIVYRDLSLGTTSTGLSELRKFMKANINAYENLHFKAKDVVVQDDKKIAVVWIMTGKFEGKPFRTEGMSIMELRNGKVCTNSDYYK